MKTMENTEDVSLPPAQLAGWGLKIGGDEAHVTEKSHFRTAKKLAKSCTGGKIAETTRKTQFDAMNHKSNGKSRLIKMLRTISALIVAAFASHAVDCDAQALTTLWNFSGGADGAWPRAG